MLLTGSCKKMVPQVFLLTLAFLFLCIGTFVRPPSPQTATCVLTHSHLLLPFKGHLLPWAEKLSQVQKQLCGKGGGGGQVQREG
jgi:hypothetical protein